jgi:hypothetical protein
VNAAGTTTYLVASVSQFSGIAERFDPRRNGVLIGNTAVPSYADLTAQPNTTYWYDVSAVNAGTASASSARDLATTYLFATPNILPNSFIKATHLMETRSAVNIARAAAGLPPATFTDANVANIRPKAVHITELRNALDEARARLGVPPMAYVQSSVVAGSTLVAAVDVMELRRGVE